MLGRRMLQLSAVAVATCAAACSLVSLDGLDAGTSSEGGGDPSGSTSGSSSGEGGASASSSGGSGSSASSASASSASASSSSAEASSSSGGPDCERIEGRPIDPACGLFVDAASRASRQEGTQDAPFRSLSDAVSASADGGAIFVCSSQLRESVIIDDDLRIVGGVDCATWAPTAGRTRWGANPGVIPLIVGGDVAIEGLDIAAEDAVEDGGSSIAVAVEGGRLTVERSSITAGAGADGPTLGPPPQLPAADDGVNGMGGCNVSALTPGGDGGTNTCGVIDVSGGVGGDGTDDSVGGAGGDGLPEPGGQGGTGQQSAMACLNGTEGAFGSNGQPGLGAAWPGALRVGGGFEVADGAPGGSGGHGRGGGGGGGASICGGAGPSGGGGGAGGCEGIGGPGGPGGGSSIAIAVRGGALILGDDVDLNAGPGGDGAPGSAGQLGQLGGQGGSEGGAGACNGGAGGSGGRGGPGGGGGGGHSVGVFSDGGEVDLGAARVATAVPGLGGPGGSNGGPPSRDGGLGRDGTSTALLTVD